jgi:hypothetical protein
MILPDLSPQAPANLVHLICTWLTASFIQRLLAPAPWPPHSPGMEAVVILKWFPFKKSNNIAPLLLSKKESSKPNGFLPKAQITLKVQVLKDLKRKELPIPAPLQCCLWAALTPPYSQYPIYWECSQNTSLKNMNIVVPPASHPKIIKFKGHRNILNCQIDNDISFTVKPCVKLQRKFA